MLTGTWLEREKLLAGLFFLLLLLLLLLPPELTVLPPDTFLFRRLFGACLAGSARKSQSGQWKRYNQVVSQVSTLRQLHLCMFYLEALPFFATSGRGRSSGSLWGSDCTSYVWTSAPAWAPISHKATGTIKSETKWSIKRTLMSGQSIQRQKSNFAYTEVVECGVGQPTSGDVFGQLIQHLGILHDLMKGMREMLFVWINLSEKWRF